MKIEFDPRKSARNERERGIPFSLAEAFDFHTALRVEDTRRDYGETRTVAYGYVGERLHVLCFKKIPGGFRVISLRKANKRERRKYAQENQTSD